MTRKRNDGHSTEFGLWLREQNEIDSKLGYLAYNLDYIWRNYKTGEWMMIEEKRYMSEMRFPQKETFKAVHLACRHDKKYKGFYLLQFEKTSPDDGDIYINGKLSSRQELFDLLHFKRNTNKEQE